MLNTSNIETIRKFSVVYNYIRLGVVLVIFYLVYKYSGGSGIEKFANGTNKVLLASLAFWVLFLLFIFPMYFNNSGHFEIRDTLGALFIAYPFVVLSGYLISKYTHSPYGTLIALFYFIFSVVFIITTNKGPNLDIYKPAAPNSRQFICSNGNFLTLDKDNDVRYTIASEHRISLLGNLDPNSNIITADKDSTITNLDFIVNCKNSDGKSISDLYKIK